MNYRRAFDIAFVSLKPGVHEYEYHIQDKFFTEYQVQEFKNCDAHVKLTLDKQIGFMLLKFEVGGTVQAGCDRCGNNFPLELWDEFNIVVKMADNPEEMNELEDDPDVFYISRGESHLNVADWIYEFINLSIPMQKMCSEKQMGGTYCNKEVLAMLEKLEKQEEPKSNSIWKGLDKFKDLES